MMKLKSRTIRLRLIEREDAVFVLGLRLDSRLNQFISPVTPDLEAQKRWIAAYKADEIAKKQFYFIIERHDGTPCGTVRIYDTRDDSFCWGSWILNEHKPYSAALESALLIYDFGFGELGFNKARLDVMKQNPSIGFHKKMGAVEVFEDEASVYFEMTRDRFQAFKQRFAGRFEALP